MELPKVIKDRIDAEALRNWPEHIFPSGNQRRAFTVGARNEALRYLPLLRFAGCPELLIENPNLIIGKKPTDEDMEWARNKADELADQAMKEHNEHEAKVRALVEALERIANPLKYFQDEAKKDGSQLNGPMALQIANNPDWLKQQAEAAIKNYNS